MRKCQYHQDIANLSVFILWTGEMNPSTMEWRRCANRCHRCSPIAGTSMFCCILEVNGESLLSRNVSICQRHSTFWNYEKSTHTVWHVGKEIEVPAIFDIDARHNLSCHKSEFLSKCSLADAQGFIVTYQTRQSSYFHLDWDSINYTTG